MEYIVLIPIIVIIITIFSKSKSNTKSKLPPGPKPWPIIGNILELGDKPHQTFTELSKTYGPIMFVKLGFVPTIVISSPDIAQEMFLKHDITFSDRNVPDSVRAMDHDKYSMAWLPVSPKWRNLRKIAAVQLFTNNRLDGGKELRQKKAQELGDYVRQCRETSTPVDINKAASTSVSNLLSNTIFSMDLNSHTSTNSQEFNELILHMMEVAVTPNVSDLFPMLKHLDLQGVLKRTNKFTHKIMKIFDKIIKERLLKDPMNLTDDVLGTLLKLLEDKQMSIHDVKHFLMDLFTGGIHTTSVTVEWAMAELLHNPQKMKKAQIEIHEVVGKDKAIQESDITKLPYLQAIVKETLRLHPPAPLLIPRKTIKDVELCNYFVPQNSNILINLWGMARDSTIWSNPCLFSPERFLDSQIDFKGRYFEFIPFGSGRRICPGLPLAHRMIHLLLATLISFNWKISPDTIDMEEKFGISLLKLKPLQLIPYFG